MLIVCPGAIPTVRGAEGGVLVVFVSKASDVHDLKLTELRRLFSAADDSGLTGRRRVAVNHVARSVDRIRFDRAVLHMEAAEVRRFWIDRKLRGLPGAPRAVSSVPMIVHLVAWLPAGIGYARPAQLTDDVRIIHIDGKAPGDAGYPLQFAE